MEKMILQEKIVLKGTITLLTGLHIGGAKTSLDIGGLDLPVIKTPKGVPYIPGSSLKGKIRSLLAKKEDSNDVKEDSIILRKMFGGVETKEKPQEITRLIFRDAYLDEEAFKVAFPKNAVKLETDFTEIKTENTINRKNGTAQHPRTIERVPAGAVFHFEIVLDKYNDSEAKEILAKLKEGVELLNNDYLGGSGTRGYGKVKMEFDEESNRKFPEN
ncbi:type III-A CRISPR-associated RAMP protein Csm3 [Raineya orbicola]|uniref:CRISPR system Cms endoribonuclease Csm3 n=1 Tax=Raineya orbicola TaxID=2016530 RepID=A0A2N3IBF1_9BACT|nr:type III-A CRISPR-associated RAMP protein Csm3 [Raineya orbicola]PKQ67672.1 CRISPR type III-A/MTUBE-associated RAMP protein Csm3 [Raineya orbicola]